MIEFLQNLLLTHSTLTYLLAFAGAFFEAIAFIGIFVPGTAIVVITGVLSEQWPDIFVFRSLFLLIFSGAFFGNLTTYLLGRYYGPPFFSEKNFYLKRQYLVRARTYFETHGGKSIFTSQFLGPLRSVVPLVAGMAEMSLLKFLLWTLIGSFSWALTYIGIGYIFGASWEAINLWGTRLTIFILGLTGLGILNWVIGRFLVRHERQVRTIIYSIGQSILAGFLSNEHVAALLRRYPSFFNFFKNRLAVRRVFGLPFTLAILISLIILFYLLLIMHAIIVNGPLLDADQRLLGAAIFIRDPLLNYLLFFVTNLAGPALCGLIVAFALLLWLEGRDYRLYVFLIGTGIIYWIQYALKLIFGRSRPDQSLALVLENLPSFPSAHAVMAVVVMGFCLFTILRSIRSWRFKIFVILSWVTLIWVIGFSRVYLGVHWTSDVLGGYLLGGWWLVIMLTVAYIGEKTFYQPRSERAKPMVRFVLIFSLLVIYLLGAGIYGWRYPMRVLERGTISVLPKLEAARFNSKLLLSIPRQTETLTGRAQAPINLVFVGSRHDVEKVFKAAGWEMADPISLASTAKIIKAAVDNQPYPTAPFSPQFYDGRVQDIGWQKGTAIDSARQRHHIRLWLAPLSLKSDELVWVASASFDSGVAYSEVLKFPTHVISPDLDRERDYIKADLVAQGSVLHQETIQLVDPILGTTGAGSPFFTDGQADVLWLRSPLN